MEVSKDVLRATTNYTKEDRTKSWVALFSTIIILSLIWAGTFLEPTANGIINNLSKLTFSILLSLMFVRLFVIYHDYLHNAILQKSKLAEVLFTIWGMYILSPPKVWRDSHNFHHSNNSKLYSASIGSFPIITKEQYLRAKKSDRMMYRFIRSPFTIVMGYIFTFLFDMTLFKVYQKKKVNWMSAASFALHAGVGATIWILAGFPAFIFSFFLPHFIAGALGTYLFYAQHNFPGVTFKNKKDWTYLDAALNSSSHMKMPALMNYFTANIGLHHIHHANPSIPFYRLPEVYKNVPELQQAKTTSLAPAEILRCLKLKFWDGDLNRMITLKELNSMRKLKATPKKMEPMAA